MIYYHATRECFIKSIMEKGLMPQNHFSYDGQVMSGVIYLTPDYDIAESFAEAADNISDSIYKSPIVILQVDSKNLDEERFCEDENIILNPGEQPYTFAYKGSIPAKFLKNAKGMNCIDRYAEEMESAIWDEDPILPSKEKLPLVDFDAMLTDLRLTKNDINCNRNLYDALNRVLEPRGQSCKSFGIKLDPVLTMTASMLPRQNRDDNEPEEEERED